MPETSDSDFSWREYVRRNNDELVATYGNLVHRVLSMVNRNFDGKVPDPGVLGDLDKELLDEARRRFQETGESIEVVRLRAALSSPMSLAQSANRYLDQKAPWSAVKTDMADAARTLWTTLSVINCLKTLLYPFIPFSSEKLHTMLGFEGSVRDSGWTWSPDDLSPGQSMGKPEPLFLKLDEELVEAEALRIGDGE
ncbi:MAG: class I tRNA ligase family protein, partial [Chloroflexi bacterium]|nr:class I tRNA ligase family protein [Chloroflexota bacterium]